MPPTGNTRIPRNWLRLISPRLYMRKSSLQPRTQPRTKMPSIRISWALILLFEDSKRAPAAAEGNLCKQDDCATTCMPSICILWTPYLEDDNERETAATGNFVHVAKGVSLFIEVARLGRPRAMQRIIATPQSKVSMRAKSAHSTYSVQYSDLYY